MVPTRNGVRRTAALSGLVGAACAAVVAIVPTAAVAASYTCNNGVLYEDGNSLGTRTKSNPYELGDGISTWCSGNRIVTVYKVPNN